MQKRLERPFSLADLPDVMRQNGWTVGARLMERWFSRGACAMTDREKSGTDGPSDIDERVVTMAWALRFPRVVEAHNHLIATWASGERGPRSASEVATKFKAWRASNALHPGAPFRFGDLSRPASEIDGTCQINRDVIESSIFGAVDDFYAAIGKGTLKLAVSGLATPLIEGKWRLTIDQIGTYLRDTYDFNGDQSLGSWSRTGFARFAPFAKTMPIDPQLAPADADNGYYAVTNASFRGFREYIHRGGDFVIFSDVHRMRLVKPIVMEIGR